MADADAPPDSPPAIQSLSIADSQRSTGAACVAQIRAHLDYYDRERVKSFADPDAPDKGPSSLMDLAAQQLIRSLRDDPTPESLEIVLKSTPPNLLTKVLQDPSLHYSVFRRWGKSHEIKKDIVDIDEYVFLNERDMRRRPESEWNRLLVTLNDADGIWPESELGNDGIRRLKRKLPPREHYAILGEGIDQVLRIHGSTESFQKRFDRMTGDILKGLNWDNVFVAGGLPLSCLTCVDDESEKKLIKSDIDLYIYGLSPEDGNAKAEEVWNVWSENAGDKQKMVIRNAKTFTFISEFPTRRVQVILKMIPSPAAVLLNFDLDQCAIGWNGKEVLMLPRCARALETGYTVFTSDLIHGHYLGDRRATQESRVFKYADRGYGILFLAPLLESSKVNFTDRKTRRYPRLRQGEEEPKDKDIVQGKKAVLRIAYLARDTVHRFFIGPTEATVLLANDYYYDEFEPEDLKQIKEWVPGPPPQVDFSELDGRTQYRGGAPGSRNGLKMFESFMRMVAAWTFDAEWKIKLQKDSFEPTGYIEGSYDDLPTYQWNAQFDQKQFAASIDSYNDTIFESLKESIRNVTNTQIWHTNYQAPNERWSGYLTRRIRRIITAPTFSAVMSKQVTIPIWVPATLASFIYTTMEKVRELHDLPATDEFSIIIPGHRPSNSTSPPEIPDNLPDDYNLYFWVIGNTTSWARLDRRVDEIFEVLWTLYHAQFTFPNLSFYCTPPRNDGMDRELSHLLEIMFERRPIPGTPSEPGVWPDRREKGLWNDWLRRCPHEVCRNYVEPSVTTYKEMFWFKPIEEWYWKGDKDGANDGGVWREWTKSKAEEWKEKQREERWWRKRWQKSVPNSLDDGWSWENSMGVEMEDEDEDGGNGEVIEEKRGEKRRRVDYSIPIF